MSLWKRLFGSRLEPAKKDPWADAVALRANWAHRENFERDAAELVERSPDAWFTHFSLGEMLFRNCDTKKRRRSALERSVDHLQRASQLGAERPEPHLVLAASVAFQQFDRAAEHYRLATCHPDQCCDDQIYPLHAQSQDHWEFAQAAGKHGQHALSRSAFERACHLRSEYREELPDVYEARDDWVDVVFQLLPNREAFCAQDVRWWRLWLRRDRQQLHDEGAPVMPFLMERIREKRPDVPLELLELAAYPASTPPDSKFLPDDAAMAVPPAAVKPASLDRAKLRTADILAAARAKSATPASPAATCASTIRPVTWTKSKCTLPQALVDWATDADRGRLPYDFINAMGRCGGPDAVGPLLDWFKEPASLPLNVIFALAEIGDERAVKRLVDELGEAMAIPVGEIDTQRMASYALEKILERHAANMSDRCLGELAALKHTHRLEEHTTDRGRDDEHTYLVTYGVDVDRVKELACAELDRRSTGKN